MADHQTPSAFPSWARPVAPDVIGMQVLIVNLFFVGEPVPGGQWTLVDAGMLNCAARVQKAADELYGPGARPEAIILTHGHFDHIGAVEELAAKWDVPVYAHHLELPYVTEALAYPPPDPSVNGGLMAKLSPLYPRTGAKLEGRVHALPEDGSVPGLPGWKAIYTPGHSPGHVSLFRPKDGVLLAGDAFVTTQQESALAVLQQTPEVRRPPGYYTINWQQAQQSVEKLAALHPSAVGTGHGPPMSGQQMQEELNKLAHTFSETAIPEWGFYAQHPAQYDEEGKVVSKTPNDPRPKFILQIVGIALGALLLRAFAKGTSSASNIA